MGAITVTDLGSFRPFYGRFWDDPDVRALTHLAYRVLTTLKGTLHATGIGFVFPDLLAQRCACSADGLEAALQELEQPKRSSASALGWVVRERAVVWVVNGLRFERSIRPTDSEHRAHVAEWLSQFGGASSPLQIVHAFRDHDGT